MTHRDEHELATYGFGSEMKLTRVRLRCTTGPGTERFQTNNLNDAMKVLNANLYSKFAPYQHCAVQVLLFKRLPTASLPMVHSY